MSSEQQGLDHEPGARRLLAELVRRGLDDEALNTAAALILTLDEQQSSEQKSTSALPSDASQAALDEFGELLDKELR